MASDTNTVTIVALFADRASADDAARNVVRHGIAAEHVHVHEQGTAPRNAAGITFDEYATGGFFSNFVGLLNGLLNTKPSPGTAQSYAEAVRLEGVAVSVDECSSAVASTIESELRAAGARDVATTKD